MIGGTRWHTAACGWWAPESRCSTTACFTLPSSCLGPWAVTSGLPLWRTEMYVPINYLFSPCCLKQCILVIQAQGKAVQSICKHTLKFFSRSTTFFQWLTWMYCIQVAIGGMLKEYVQGAGGPQHCPLCRPLYALGLDAWLHMGRLKWKKWSLPSQACCSLNGNSIPTEHYSMSWLNLCVSSRQEFWRIFCPEVLYTNLQTVSSWWRHWGVVVASHFSSWWMYGLILCERLSLSLGCDQTYSCLVLFLGCVELKYQLPSMCYSGVVSAISWIFAIA
jgi:hypothetical protein